MVGLAAFIVGIFALVWSLVIASVSLAFLLALLIPLLVLCIVFRIGFGLMRLAAMFMLLCIVAVWLI
jgi:hypothetical protein